MTNKLEVVVCDTDDKANAAIAMLTGRGFPAASISKETVTSFAYDANSYSNGVADVPTGKWVVIGRT
jgi:hypothetical protein